MRVTGGPSQAKMQFVQAANGNFPLHIVANATCGPISMSGGPATIQGNEAQIKTIMAMDGTFKNAFVNVQVNANTVDGTTTLRKNGANTGLVITVTASTTGKFSDTSDSVPVVQSDLVNWFYSQATTGATTASSLAVEFDPS